MAYCHAPALRGLPSLTGNPYALSQEEGTSTRRILNRAVPQYPDLARSMHIEGTVKLLVAVAPNGKPTYTKLWVAILCWQKVL
jgi:hypothetical protein